MPDADRAGSLPCGLVESRPRRAVLLRGTRRVRVELVDGRPVLHDVWSAGAEEQVVAEQARVGIHAQFAQHPRHRAEDRQPQVRPPPAVDLHADVEDDQLALVLVGHASFDDSRHDVSSVR